MTFLYLVTVTFLSASGGLMLLAPELWFSIVPGVDETGPLNVHFVRDVGVAYVVSAAGLLWRAIDSVRGRAAAIVGAAFLAGHATVHSLEGAFGHGHGSLGDLVSVYGAAAIACLLALSDRSYPAVGGLFKPLIRRSIRRFGDAFNYDTHYMQSMLDTTIDGFARFSLLEDFSRYEAAPDDVLFAVRITAAISEDCGPCTQLVVDMALTQNMKREQVRAVVSADSQAMSENVRLGFGYARAVINHAAEADTLRAEIERRWGPKAIVSLALAIAASRAYPMIKYGMGYGKLCTRIQVGEEDTQVERAWRAEV